MASRLANKFAGSCPFKASHAAGGVSRIRPGVIVTTTRNISSRDDGQALYQFATLIIAPRLTKRALEILASVARDV